jgi:hypothetical protein
MTVGTIEVNIVTPLSGDFELLTDDFTIDEIMTGVACGDMWIQATTYEEFGIFNGAEQLAVIVDSCHHEGYFTDLELEAEDD